MILGYEFKKNTWCTGGAIYPLYYSYDDALDACTNDPQCGCFSDHSDHQMFTACFGHEHDDSIEGTSAWVYKLLP